MMLPSSSPCNESPKPADAKAANALLPAADNVLYHQVAARVEGLIDAGTFRVGDRLPSVRRLSRDWRVSITTVLTAYRGLENRGVIEARPQSGYYVRARRALMLCEPRRSDPLPDPCEVSLPELALRLHRDASNPRLVQFGAAIPNPELLPVQKINTLLSSVVRRHPHRVLATSSRRGPASCVRPLPGGP